MDEQNKVGEVRSLWAAWHEDTKRFTHIWNYKPGPVRGREMVRMVEAPQIQAGPSGETGASPAPALLCARCGKNPAACIGQYEGHGGYEPACNECCAHGNEDGFCTSVADVSGLLKQMNGDLSDALSESTELFRENQELKKRALEALAPAGDGVLRDALILCAEEAEAAIEIMGPHGELVRNVQLDVYTRISKAARAALSHPKPATTEHPAFTREAVFSNMLRNWSPEDCRSFYEMLSRRPDFNPAPVPVDEGVREADLKNPMEALRQSFGVTLDEFYDRKASTRKPHLLPAVREEFIQRLVNITSPFAALGEHERIIRTLVILLVQQLPLPDDTARTMAYDAMLSALGISQGQTDEAAGAKVEAVLRRITRETK